MAKGSSLSVLESYKLNDLGDEESLSSEKFVDVRGV